jgi:hypothetical protein
LSLTVLAGSGGATTDTTDPRVDTCIDAPPGRQQAIRPEVRQLVPRRRPAGYRDHQAQQPPLLHPGGLHSSTTGASSPGSEGIITRSHASKTGRTVAIRYGEAVTAPALIAMFRQVITNDLVGGWRELKRQADPR